ncbi:MAG: hypothetical protein M1837_004104 [Sclerophora amabilis]|nr:MAG: hypothetical protein M1837_004104 [Sclerophora amabilis]
MSSSNSASPHDDSFNAGNHDAQDIYRNPSYEADQNGQVHDQMYVAESVDAVPRPKRIACVLCRKRKLRCDGSKPSCGTCTRLGHECAYDEVRRKSGPKRGYVKLLEKRLAHVESQLKSQDPSETAVNEAASMFPSNGEGSVLAQAGFNSAEPINFNFQGQDINTGIFQDPEYSTASPQPLLGSMHGWELNSLGVDEPLPPPHIIQDLTDIYFQKVHRSVPMIHPERFRAALKLPPQAQPPICLRYAMWCFAASVTDNYLEVQDHFYQRARKYIELDEMKGHGESLINIAHSQCWSLLATYEFKMMYFPRAWMSTGRGIRLAQMMGLHRLDGNGLDVKQCLALPKDWTEKEERRRTFWMAFCSDRYASVGTGWPMTVDEKDVLTNLPSTEEAFEKSKPQGTKSLKDALSPSGPTNLSPFAGVVLMACLFGRNLTHLHRPDADERDDDLNGEFWKRHRNMDNILANTSLNLPDHLRLPVGLQDPHIVFTNMNIHASTICLHQAAIFKADKHGLSDRVSSESRERCLSAAIEITSIMKRICHLDLSGVNPFIAFCLYVAARVFVQMYKIRRRDESIKSSMYFLIDAMQTLKKKNPLTESFLVQLDVDLEGSGMDYPNNNARFPFTLKKGVAEIPASATSATYVTSTLSQSQPPICVNQPSQCPVFPTSTNHENSSNSEDATAAPDLGSYATPWMVPEANINLPNRLKYQGHAGKAGLQGGPPGLREMFSTSTTQIRLAPHSSEMDLSPDPNNSTNNINNSSSSSSNSNSNNHLSTTRSSHHPSPSTSSSSTNPTTHSGGPPSSSHTSYTTPPYHEDVNSASSLRHDSTDAMFYRPQPYNNNNKHNGMSVGLTDPAGAGYDPYPPTPSQDPDSAVNFPTDWTLGSGMTPGPDGMFSQILEMPWEAAGGMGGGGLEMGSHHKDDGGR